MKYKCGMRIADCGLQKACAPTTAYRNLPITTRRNSPIPNCKFRLSHVEHSAIRIPNSEFHRPAFTLVELLVTILILAILSTVILGASRVAMEGARATRTKTTITKLHTLLMERYESYQTRRVEVRQSILNEIEKEFRKGKINSRERGRLLAVARLNALRELMKLEMPDRWSDVIGTAVPNSNPLKAKPRIPLVLRTLPPLTAAYRRRYYAMSMDDGSQITRERIQTHQGAECFYLFIILATGDGEARTLFSQQDIGDVDGDGAPEFLDGWGQPIEFLRWPAGFVSDLQTVVLVDGSTTPKRLAGDPDADHDPFDPFRVDKRAYRLVPLIYSAGPDGDLDIEVAPGNTTSLDPYAQLKDAGGKLLNLLGTQRDNDNDGDNSLDNLHNHLMNNK